MRSVEIFESLKSYDEFGIKIKSSQFRGQLTIGLSNKKNDLEHISYLRFDKTDCITFQFPKFGEIYGTIYGGDNHDMTEIFYFCEDDILRNMIILLHKGSCCYNFRYRARIG